MIIANEFTVSAPIDKAWALLTDLEEVAPLMPGAQLVGREGDEFLGKVKLKVGPVNSDFNGKAHFIERDETQHKALIDARGKESRGSGNAAAVVTLQLHEAGDRTRVTVDTDLKVVGKLAQFGSGMLQQVSEKLLGQFVDALEVKLAGGPAPVAAAPAAAAPAAGATDATASAPAPKFTPTAESEPIDLLELAGGTSIQKYAGIGIAAVLLLLVVAILRRRHHTDA
ncbi:MAG: SRPBCC family protein [Mycobacterium sp.]|jgi:carbon monoxide dehydrogenase subunit G